MSERPADRLSNYEVDGLCNAPLHLIVWSDLMEQYGQVSMFPTVALDGIVEA